MLVKAFSPLSYDGVGGLFQPGTAAFIGEGGLP